MSCFENIEYKEDDFLLLNPLTIESDQINLLKDEQEPNLPKLNTPLVDINCDYFKIKNNLSELKTQFQKSEARKNLGIDNSLSSTSKVTYSELVSLRNNASLIAGMKYRITDYTTTTVQKYTKSANHPFDIIVEAVSENELSELAQATQHDGDTYFDANALEAWQLWYDLDNDIDKYEWADTIDGKGVIYRMIDEKRNDCPYDFKNILFFTDRYISNTTSDNYYYTFSYVVNRVLYDGTVEKEINYCFDNRIGDRITGVNKKSLSGNVFRNVVFTNRCYSNTFGNRCYSNIFGYNCYLNVFGYYCYLNVFGNDCYNNKFGNTYFSNTMLNHCTYNKFGNSCFSNIFCNDFRFNMFENDCCYNKFGDSCSNNTFGNNCCYHKFEAGLQYRTLNSGKTSITFNEEYYDDGTNALVPIKHPDLSTQPSILPYKFVGQYVYEQLIANKGESYISISISNTLAVKNPLIISIDAIGTLYINALLYNINDDVLTIDLGDSSMRRSTPFVKIVYTSMPEEGGYYYNSVSKKGILIKVNLLNTTPLALYNGDVLIEPVIQGQEYYYSIPDDYKAYSSGLSIESTNDTSNLTIECYIPDIGETRFLECNNIGFIELGGLIDKAKQYLVIITIK